MGGARFAAVALGGLVGSVARYGVALAMPVAGSGFPAATFAVNLAGSFVLGVVLTLSRERGALSDEVTLLLGTGFCGGFTTMSTFSYETVVLLRAGSALLAAGYVAGTLVGCSASVWVGILLARLL